MQEVTKVTSWGNSLGVRIPKYIARQLRLRAGSTVQMLIKDSTLAITPVARERYSLKGLVRGITSQNRHEEYFVGDSAGKEVW